MIKITGDTTIGSDRIECKGIVVTRDPAHPLSNEFLDLFLRLFSEVTDTAALTVEFKTNAGHQWDGGSRIWSAKPEFKA